MKLINNVTMLLLLASCASSGNRETSSERFYGAIKTGNYGEAFLALNILMSERKDLDVLDLNLEKTHKQVQVTALHPKFKNFLVLYMTCAKPKLEQDMIRTSCIDLSACDPDENVIVEDIDDRIEELQVVEQKCKEGGELDVKKEELSKIVEAPFAKGNNVYLTVIRPRIEALEKEKLAKIEKEKDIKDNREKESLAKQEERKSKGIDIYSSACNARSALAHFNSIMVKEKEVGKVSGYVNKDALYEAGLNIVNYKKIQKQAEDEHLKRFGKAIDMKKCKCDNGLQGIDCK